MKKQENGGHKKMCTRKDEMSTKVINEQQEEKMFRLKRLLSVKAIMFMILLISVGCLNLVAQEWAPGELVVKFEEHVQLDEVSEFIADYEQYGLVFLWNEIVPIWQFHFNSDLIDEHEFLEIVKTDERVYAAGLNFNWWNNHIVINLVDVGAYYDFLIDYLQYNLSMKNWYTLHDFVFYDAAIGVVYSFNASLINPFDILEIIRADERVLSAGTFIELLPGEITVELYYPVVLEDFISDYSQYDLNLIQHEFESEIVDVWSGYFSFSTIATEELIQVMSYDARVRASYGYHVVLLPSPPDPPVLNDYERTNPSELLKIYSYPNPARSGNVTFKTEVGRQMLEVSIYNVRGQLVQKSSDFQTKNGESVFVWDRKDNRGNEVATGIYFYRIQTNNGMYTGKQLLLKTRREK